MTISEPTTLATDYLLAGVTAWLAWKLFRSAQLSRFWWAIAFAALALGAFLGGTWHGFLQSGLLWKAALLSIGVASGAMLAGSAFATLSGAPRRLALGFAAAKLALYSAWILGRDEFIFVVIDSGVAFAVVAALHLWRFNPWIVAGIGLSVAAALVQASGLAPHPRFNHNDLYHVIQIGAMFLLYRGARRLTDQDPQRRHAS